LRSLARASTGSLFLIAGAGTTYIFRKLAGEENIPFFQGNTKILLALSGRQRVNMQAGG
jgi:hypothetical protein